MNELFLGAFRGKRVLVTGHTGFKGSWLCEWLLELGAEVAGFSIGLPYSPCHFEQLDLARRIRHFEGDIRVPSAIQKVFQEFQPEVVFHLAAQSLVRRSYDEPHLTIETNAMGTANVLEAIRKNPEVKAAVLITSDKCYLNVGWEYGYRETDTLGGEDPYSASKACAEMIAYTYIHSYFSDSQKTRIATARAGNVIGGGDWAENRIVPDCMRAWRSGIPAEIRNPHHTRPWQHVLEPLSGYLWLGARLLQAPQHLHAEAFNFGPNNVNNQTVSALVSEMKKHWNEVRWETPPSPKSAVAEAPLLQLNCDKALQRLSWCPVLSYEDGIRLTVEWYRSFKKENSVQSLTAGQIAYYQEKARQAHLPWTLTSKSFDNSL